MSVIRRCPLSSDVGTPEPGTTPCSKSPEKKRKREEDEALQASAEEEFITVSKRDLVFVLRVSRRAIEAARKCGDFLEKGLLAFRAQETIFYEAKGAAERM